MFVSVTAKLAEGFSQNLILFFATLVSALPLGLIITFGEMSKYKIISMPVKLFVWLIRGTPLMLQLFVVFYVPGLVFGTPFRSRMLAAFIAFSINYDVYFAEIYRGAIENIPKVQFEAGKVLGLKASQVFFHIILFQIVKRITDPIGNEVITLIKDTSIARVIAVHEMLMQAQEYTMQGLIWPLFYTGVFFLSATAIITFIFNRLERSMAYAES
jgi:polar amino acid transport system permease protein